MGKPKDVIRPGIDAAERGELVEQEEIERRVKAVRRSLREDAADLMAFKKRQKEPAIEFASLVCELRRRGKL